MLTKRQRQLFRLEKHRLVDTITNLENEISLMGEELEMERKMRLKLEVANINAQEEIDASEDKAKYHIKDKRIDMQEYVRGVLDIEAPKEEGENGVL